MTTILAGDRIVTDDETVAVGKATLLRALLKARLLYVAACERDDDDPGPDDECWTEFELLGEYLRDGIDP